MQHLGTVTLTTERFTLRRFRLDDAEAMYANWASDKKVTQFLTWPAHANVEVTRDVLSKWVASYNKDDFYQWAITLQETDEPIGSISVVSFDEATNTPEVGYCIGHAWWHDHVATEALAAVLEFLFTQVGVERVFSRHSHKNRHSGGVMRNCGMSYEGTMRRALRCNEGIGDAYVYGILASDWEAYKAHKKLEGSLPKHPRGNKTPQDSRTVTTHLLRHEDINGSNRLFGGKLMQWIDDAAGIAAKRHTGAEITTACVDTLEFHAPAFLDDVVVIEANVTYVGKCSLEVRVDSFMEDMATGKRKRINTAFLTEVCVDEKGKPVVVPYGLALTTSEEYDSWEAALFRKEMRQARKDSGI